jgi:chorismate synthase
MAGNTFGQLFRITTFGESHGPLIGVVIDGCPAGLEVDMDYVQMELNRRRPGQSAITTGRKESDFAELLSGVYEGKSTGAPIAIVIRNHDHHSKDYEFFRDHFRPGHGDFTWWLKYGHRDHRGGGRSSARETAARVAAGAIAKLILKKTGVAIHAFTQQVGEINMVKDYRDADLGSSEFNPVRCPDPDTAEKMIAYIEELRNNGDSTGGVVACVVKNCPAGLGELVFDRLEADLAKAMLSINAVKGFEIGEGFAGSAMKGSEFNDKISQGDDGRLKYHSNRGGGITGGISTGQDIYFRVAFRPVATVQGAQPFITKEGKVVETEMPQGRHDPCVVPRAVAIVEAMAAIVLADHYLRNRAARL